MKKGIAASVLVGSSLLVALFVVPGEACTSVMAGPEATVDGSVWVGQSDDGEGADDERMVYVPAQEWPRNAKRPVYDYGSYPRIVDTQRKVPAYYPSKLVPNKTSVIGYISVARTYAYFEATTLSPTKMESAFGESTCSAKTYAKNVANGGPSCCRCMSLAGSQRSGRRPRARLYSLWAKWQSSMDFTATQPLTREASRFSSPTGQSSLSFISSPSQT